MKMTEIRGAEIKPISVSDDIRCVRRQASMQLQYGTDTLADEVEFNKLADLMHRENLKPFLTSSVREYTNKIIAPAHRMARLQSIIGFMAVLTLIVGMLFGAWCEKTFLIDPLPIQNMTALGVLVALITYLVCAVCLSRAKRHLPWAWTALAIDKYKRPVPVEVLQFAMRVKKEVQNVVFEVVFPETRSQIAARTDPFFRIHLRGFEPIYTHVWDEPDFRDDVANLFRP